MRPTRGSPVFPCPLFLGPKRGPVLALHLALMFGLASQTQQVIASEPQAAVREPTAARSLPAHMPIQTAVEGGEFQRARDLAEASPQHLGEIDFDFWYALAALGVGQAGQAVLALERVAIQQPDLRVVQLQLGRAYFLAGDLQLAKQAFERLQPEATSEESVLIADYLRAIRLRESHFKTTRTLFIEAGVLVDTNINSGVSAGLLDADTLLFVPPGARNEREQGAAVQLTVGAAMSHPIAPGWAIYGQATAQARQHNTGLRQQFDHSSLALQGGLRWTVGDHTWRLGLDRQQSRFDDQPLLVAQSMLAEWAVQQGSRQRYSATLQLGEREFEDLQLRLGKSLDLPRVTVRSSIQASDFRALSVSTQHAFPGTWAPIASAALHVGQEKNQRGRADLSRDYASVRLGLLAHWGTKTRLSATWTYQSTHYGAAYGLGLPTRSDQTHQVGLGVRYVFNSRWSVAADLSHTQQDSNIALHRFDRSQAMLSVRRSFE